MLKWSQSKGELTKNGEFWARGYSGHGDGINNPAYQQVHDVGPLPQGQYKILPPTNSPRTGPFTLPLIALDIDKCFGRSDFRIHGDNAQGNQSASHGCIILPRAVRERINGEIDRTIEVIA
jgi:lipoprotein-anchoring transpeptidase ErfK/SrfK